MTAGERRLIAGVQGKLSDLMDALDGPGAQYARELVASVVHGSPRTPQKPRDLHPDLARAVRDVVLEETELELGSLPVRFR